MQTVAGAGCWAGRAEGTVIWLGGDRTDAGPAADRAVEVLLFRAALAQAASDLERWAERQPTLEGRVLLQGYKEALLEDAWIRRVCAMIDAEGLRAAPAVLTAARAIAAVLGRSEDLCERKESLETAASWLAGRLAPAVLPPDAVLAAPSLSPVELLDLGGRPALLAEPTAPPVIGDGPVVWGVPGLTEAWAGRRVAIDGARITLDIPPSRWWALDDDHLNGHPICYLNGDLEAIGRMARKLGRPPIAMVRRLDDLAAVPLFAAQTAGIAVDLDKLGPAPKLKHPGVQFLLHRALESAHKAGVPITAGGDPANRHPDAWLALGFTALHGPGHFRGGATHAVRGGAQGGL